MEPKKYHCAECHEEISVLKPGKRLTCLHNFHKECILNEFKSGNFKCQRCDYDSGCNKIEDIEKLDDCDKWDFNEDSVVPKERIENIKKGLIELGSDLKRKIDLLREHKDKEVVYESEIDKVFNSIIDDIEADRTFYKEYHEELRAEKKQKLDLALELTRRNEDIIDNILENNESIKTKQVDNILDSLSKTNPDIEYQHVINENGFKIRYTNDYNLKKRNSKLYTFPLTEFQNSKFHEVLSFNKPKVISNLKDLFFFPVFSTVDIYDGSIYIFDGYKRVIHKLDKDFNYQKYINGHNNDSETPYEFGIISDMIVSKSKELLVCEAGLPEMKIYNKDLQLRNILTRKNERNFKLNDAIFLCFDYHNNILVVVDKHNHKKTRIQFYNQFYEIYKTINHDDLKKHVETEIMGMTLITQKCITDVYILEKNQLTRFNDKEVVNVTFKENAISICKDHEDFIYVGIDDEKFPIMIFDKNLKLIKKLENKSELKFIPRKICINPINKTLMITEKKLDKIIVF